MGLLTEKEEGLISGLMFGIGIGIIIGYYIL
jgi:F0F1-type ATP synthase assembly protein I